MIILWGFFLNNISFIFSIFLFSIFILSYVILFYFILFFIFVFLFFVFFFICSDGPPYLTNQPSCFQHNKVFETGLSDFHLLTVTEFKMSFQKLQPKIINYRDYKNFDNEKFRSDICKMNLNTTDLEGFMKTVFHIFNKHAPIKRK